MIYTYVYTYICMYILYGFVDKTTAINANKIFSPIKISAMSYSLFFFIFYKFYMNIFFCYV